MKFNVFVFLREKVIELESELSLLFNIKMVVFISILLFDVPFLSSQHLLITEFDSKESF